jgi:hypothetical protein
VRAVRGVDRAICPWQRPLAREVEVVDEGVSRVSLGEDRLRLAFSRIRLEVSSRVSAPVALAIVWLVAAFVTLIWAWGLNPLAFSSPDEAVVRLGARLVSQHGQPFIKLAFPDPEDLAHPRSWLSLGDVAVPVYAPVALYAYGALLRLHRIGLLLIALLPASALAAIVAGTARLLPLGRRWLAVLVPALGFVSLYWVLRPWINLSPVISCLCWCFFLWTSWRADGKAGLLVAAALCVGMAAAIRPDYAGFLLVAAVLLILADRPEEWKLILLVFVGAGVFAVVPNLVLNRLTTGHALRAVYQIALDRQYGTDLPNGLDNPHGMSAWGVLRVLFAPMGLPTFKVAATEFKKYFIVMSPATLVGLLALVPLLRERKTTSRAIYVVAMLWVVFFVFTRLHDDVHGGEESIGVLHHSVPRYLAPVYLFAVLPPILFLGRCRKRWQFIVGAVLASLVAANSVLAVYFDQPGSLRHLRGSQQRSEALLDALGTEIPADAMVYSESLDKVLWSRWRVGVIDETGPSASSITRAANAGLPVFILEPRPGRPFRQLRAALATTGLTLVRERRGAYRVVRALQPPPPQPSLQSPQ